MRTSIRLFGLAALTAATVSCGDVVRQGSSPVFLVIDQLAGQRGATTLGTPSNPLISDVITNITSPAPCSATSPCPTIFGDSGTVTLRTPLKDTGATAALAPTSNNEVTINRVHVAVRAGRRPQHARASTCRSGSTARSPARSRRAARCTLGFELVRNVAKQESPLVQLPHQHQLHLGDRDGDVLRRRPRRQRHPDHGTDPDRVRQFWGSVGPCLSHHVRRAALALALSDRRRVHRQEHPAAGVDRTVRSRAVAQRERDPRQHQPGWRLAVVGQSDRDRSGRQGASRRCRCASTCSSAAWRRTTARCPRGRSSPTATASRPPCTPRRPARSTACSGPAPVCRATACRSSPPRPSTNFTTANPEQVVIRLVPDRRDPAAGRRRRPRRSPCRRRRRARASPCTSTRRPASRAAVRPRSPATAGISATAPPAPARRRRTPSAAAGTFNVTLTVTNDRALTNSTSQSLAVSAQAPIAARAADSGVHVLASRARRRRDGLLQRLHLDAGRRAHDCELPLDVWRRRQRRPA